MDNRLIVRWGRLAALALVGFLLLCAWLVWPAAPLQIQEQSTRGLVFSPDGQLVVVSSSSDFVDGVRDPKAYSLAISRDGHLLATGGKDGIVRVWDRADKRLLHTLTHVLSDTLTGY